jgi:UDP-2,3-diacylglucosamine pyrophosphatase LpxH
VLYIAGDVHLRGDEGEEAPFPRFLDQLARRTPARLVLLGDLFEYWLETTVAARRYEGTLARLRALREAGWALDLVLGNREIVAGRLLEVRTGCRSHWPKLDLPLGGRVVRVVHGDRLCHDPGYRFFAAWMRSFWQRRWHELHPTFVQDAVARAMRRRSRGTPTPRQPRPSRIFIDRRRVQAAARGADTLVAGHIHDSWRRSFGGVDLILVGDWPGATGHWIEAYADGRLERVERQFG